MNRINKSKIKKANSRIFKISVLICVHLWLIFAFTVSAHEGEDHSKDKPQTTTATTAKSTVTIARAECNIQTDGGQFNVQLQRVPADVRTGETSEIAVRIAEKVEGCFGGEPVPVENANDSADITTADRQAVASNLPLKFEDGFYHGSYSFSNAGNYKIVFHAVTSDSRNLGVNFPVSVVKTPINWTFWLIFTLLVFLLVGIIGAVIYKTRGYDGNTRTRARKVAPMAIVAVLIFVLGTFALAYIAPPRQTRNLAELAKLGAGATVAETEIANSLQMTLTVPKESQLLFGIKTEPSKRAVLTAGLKATGTVKAKPDAKAVVTPPVAGKIVLRAGITLGSAVGRGEQIGYVEQILDVSGQTELESQR